MVPKALLGGSSHLVSGLVHPSYKWINPTYPIYNWDYNPLTKWDEPPSIKFLAFRVRFSRPKLGLTVVADCHFGKVCFEFSHQLGEA